jgi:putative transposase
MSIRDKNLVPNEYYHIYNRGNGKHDIFLDEEDYDRFMKILYVCNSERSFNFRDSIIDPKIDAFDFKRGVPLVSILAWVLMPNHFHIVLLSPRSDLGEGYNPISEFMRKVSTAYVMYFNKKHERTGGLFEGRFKSRHIGEENYFNYIFSYVHLNPIKLIQKDWKEKGIMNKKEAINYLNKYTYSSYLDFMGEKRAQNKILNFEVLPEYFPKNRSFIKEIFEWLNIGRQDFLNK